MEKVKLSQEIFQYIFEPVGNVHYGNNIIAVINGNKAMLIDAGYEFQAKEVIEDLNKNKILIDSVIISHFHDDHMQGLKLLQGVTVYGSSYYQQTLSRWTPVEEQSYYIPTVTVDKNLKFTYGYHTIELIHNAGHSICTLLVKINNEFLFVADELMYSPTGEPLLPSATKDDIINHYVSVHNLRKLSNYIFIPGHGNVIKGQLTIERDAKNVCRYLCEVLSHDEEITVEQATVKCTCSFLHKEWHENVYK